MMMKTNLHFFGLNMLVVMTSFLVTLMVSGCCSHVVLTYPPARSYPLDFLDHLTREPCGMPRNPLHATTYTLLSAMSTVVIHWHLAYTHRGGVHIELRDSNYDVISRYPETGWALEHDVTTTSYSIVLPPGECRNCTLRILKQATDWDMSHIFSSCADVHVVTRELSSDEHCNNNGQYNGIQCICHRTFVGDRCQFQNECVDDVDCSHHGNCVDTNSTSYPRLQCYCHPGWYGRHCQIESAVKSFSEVQLTLFNYKKLSPDLDLFFRILQESQELEVVLKAKSDTWIAIGWRPLEADIKCRRFPVDSPTKEGHVDILKEPLHGCRENTQSRDIPFSQSTFSPAVDSPLQAGRDDPLPCDGHCNTSTGCLFSIHWTHEPANQSLVFTLSADISDNQYLSLGFSVDTYMPNTDIVVTWMAVNGSVYLSDRWAPSKTAPAVDSHNDLTLISGGVTSGTTVIKFSRLISPSDPHDLNLNISDCVYFLTAVGVKYDSNQTIRYHKGNRGVSSQKFCFDKCPSGRSEFTTQIPVTQVQRNTPLLEATQRCDNMTNDMTDTSGSLHPMDCTDIIIGTTIGNTSRIGDHYTRDRSTPLLDEIYGGVDSLTAAMGYQDSSETVIYFKRKLKNDDVTDWPIDTQALHVVWAKGQTQKDVVHQPLSAFEMNEITDTDYYRARELKYHGTTSHRGQTIINFHDTPPTSINPTTDANPTTAVNLPTPVTVKNISSAVNPPKCHNGGCNVSHSCPYVLKWKYNEEDDTVTFQIKATVADDQWIAIGFSQNDEMPNTDVIAAYFVQEGQGRELVPHITDRYAHGRNEPEVDQLNHVKLLHASRNDGVSEFIFSRPAKTGDVADVDLHNNGGSCPFVFYGVGGSVSSSGAMEFHPTIPTSGGRICFGFCSLVKPVTVTSTAEPNEVVSQVYLTEVNCSIKLTNLVYSSEEMGDMTMSNAKELKSTLELQLDKSLREAMSNLNRIIVQRFRSGSVIVDFLVEVIAFNEEERRDIQDQVQRHLQAIIEKAELAGYTLDKEYLQVDEFSLDSSRSRVNTMASRLNKSEIIIIVVALVLCVVGVTIVTYRFCWIKRPDAEAKNRQSLSATLSSQATTSIDSNSSEDLATSKEAQNERIFEPYVQQAYDNPGYLNPKTLYRTQLV